jgi:uncharacterized membrane protein
MISISKLFSQIICAVICLGLAQNAVAFDVDFVKDIKPIFENHCMHCHGPVEQESPRIDDRDDAMDYIEAGSAEDSVFYEVLISDNEDELMPPEDHNKPLSPAQITLIKTWINEGADWPEDVKLVDVTRGGSEVVIENEAGEESQEAKLADDADQDEAPAKPPVDPETQQVFNAIGSLHPAAVHLPIGLLLAAGLFALLSLRGNFVMSDCAYYCLWVGTLGAIVACATGWWFSPMEGRGTVETWADLLNDKHPVFWHRTGGLIVTAVAFLLALFAAGARNRDPDDGMLWKLGSILLACAIGWVGHTGGDLHYPPNHYKDLNAVYERIVNPKADEKPPAKQEPAAKADDDEASEIGSVSNE